MAETIDHYELRRSSTSNQGPWSVIDLNAHPTTNAQGKLELNDPTPGGAPNPTIYYQLKGITTPSSREVPFEVGSLSLIPSGGLLWVSKANGSQGGQECIANGVAVASDGSVYTVGQWRGTVNLGDGIIRSSAGGNVGLDIFLIKYNASGVFQWAKSIGNSDHDAAYGVKVDSAGNVIVAGTWTSHDFAPTINFGDGQTTSANAPDDIQTIFVAKFSSAGVCLWVKSFGSPFSDWGYALDLDSSNNIFVGGVFVGSIDFGNSTGTLTAAGAGGYDCFIAKLNSSGVAQWSKRFGGAGIDTLKSLAVDKDGNVLAAGYYQGTANFGGGDVPAIGANAGFLAKYSGSNGTYSWSKTFRTSESAFAHSVTTDPNNGDVIVGGSCGSGVDFGGGTRTTVEPSEASQPILGKAMFIARYSTTGTYQWERLYGNAYNTINVAYGVAVRPNGNIGVAGRLQGDTNFGGGWSFGSGVANLFVLGLTSAGVYRFARRVGNATSGTSEARGAAYHPSGSLVCAGQFAAGVDFGNGTVSNGGASQAAFTAMYQDLG